MVNNDSPYIHGMFGEHVSVRLETVTVRRRDGSPPTKLPVLVLEIEEPLGTKVTVTFEAEGAAEFGGLYSEQMRQVADAELEYWRTTRPEVVESAEAEVRTERLFGAILAREAVASANLDRGETFVVGGYTAETDYAVPPGDFLREWLDEHPVTRDQAAGHLGWSRERLDEVIGGRTPVVGDMPKELAKLTGIPADAWQRYEAQYRQDVNRILQRPNPPLG